MLGGRREIRIRKFVRLRLVFSHLRRTSDARPFLRRCFVPDPGAHKCKGCSSVTIASAKHMDRVAKLGCVLCRHIGYEPSPAEVHHIYDTADRSDWLIIGLCPEHHRGKTGFHGLGERAFNTQYKTSETKLLAETLRLLA